MSTIPNNLLEIANDAWLTLPYGVRDILKQSNWVAGFCEGYKSQLATDGREQDRLIENMRIEIGLRDKAVEILESSLKEKEKECEKLADQRAYYYLETLEQSKQIEELKAENERLKDELDLIFDKDKP